MIENRTYAHVGVKLFYIDDIFSINSMVKTFNELTYQGLHGTENQMAEIYQITCAFLATIQQNYPGLRAMQVRDHSH